jgi:adenosylhomocysteine nucleosidase
VTQVSLAIFFAVPHEAAFLKKKLKFRWQKKEFGLHIAETRLEDKPILFACLGMGKEAVKKNLSSLLTSYSFSRAILAGYAGALDPQLKKGDVVISESFSFIPYAKSGKIISVTQVAATVGEKQKLFRETQATVCDMEYETALAICQNHNIILHSVRAVSDTAQESLPSKVLAKSYSMTVQRARPFSLFCFLLKKPSMIFPFLKFVQGLTKPQKTLAQTLVKILENLSNFK